MVVKRRLPQTGTKDISTDGNGDGTIAVLLGNPMSDTTYFADAGIQEADISGNVTIGSKTTSGFTIVLDGSAVTNGVVTVTWIAQQSEF